MHPIVHFRNLCNLRFSSFNNDDCKQAHRTLSLSSHWQTLLGVTKNCTNIFSILNHIFAKSNTFEKEIKHNPQRHLKESKPISIIYLCKVDLVSSQPSPPVYLYSKMNNFPGYLSSKAWDGADCDSDCGMWVDRQSQKYISWMAW